MEMKIKDGEKEEHIKCSTEEFKMLLDAQSERENKQLLYDIVVAGGRIIGASFIGKKEGYTPPTREEYEKGLKSIRAINVDSENQDKQDSNTNG